MNVNPWMLPSLVDQAERLEGMDLSIMRASFSTASGCKRVSLQ